MQKYLFLSVFLCFSITINSQNFSVFEKSISDELIGDLYLPNLVKKPKLVILLAGSGPTNRNGNQIGVQNNSLKFLAESLAENGNAVFTFDKRFITQIIKGKLVEGELRFTDLINDVNEIVLHFKKQKKYSKIIIVGHSEGSLVGMIAAKKNIDGFVSIAGAARPIDLIIEDQFEKQYPNLKTELHTNFEKLKKGETIETENYILKSIFRKSVLPYMLSWINFNPENEIKKLKIPALIINGTNDLQVPVTEAELLKKAKPKAQIEIIENMNHVLKEVKTEEENKASYNKMEIPISKKLTEKVNLFIKNV